MDKMVELTSFLNNVDAHLAKTKLEAHGIRSYIVDEYSGTHYNAAIGGIKLSVHVSDLSLIHI